MPTKVNYTQTRTTGSNENSFFSPDHIVELESIIRKLGSDVLAQGDCFMIFDDNLPDCEAYYEYPAGKLQIEKVDQRNIQIPRAVIKLLNKSERGEVKKRHPMLNQY